MSTATDPGGTLGNAPPLRATTFELDSSALRRRKRGAESAGEASSDREQVDDVKEEVNWGKTPNGTVFRVPQTHSFVHTLSRTIHRSSLTRWTLLSLLSQPVLFYLLGSHTTVRSAFFLLYFAFWRGAYDIGFAWLLRAQSEKRLIVRTLKRWGWLDADAPTATGGADGLAWAKWWRCELEMKMGTGYAWAALPAEYNAWLVFRQLVDVVLLNDFVSYTLFAFSHFNAPAGHSLAMHLARWTLGLALIVFNLWVKVDAHRVVKDYAWYWGDAFWLMVMQHDLVFDGVYEIAPHPMYSVGYAGYYGLSMVVGSYTVFFASLAAHAAQFAFLLWFENPHIERTYGGAKKPIAARTPIDLPDESLSEDLDAKPVITIQGAPDLPTPGATEGESEVESELAEPPYSDAARKPRSDSSYSAISATTSSTPNGRKNRSKSVSMHDLTHRYFRKPVVVLSNLDLFRSADFALVLLVTYALAALVPALPQSVGLAAHFCHALAWRLFHSFGLGLLLRAQSKSKWLVRHYLKHYHYPAGVRDDDEPNESVVRSATEEAFKNWQVVYNLSNVMTYVSFAGLAWKTYHLPLDWTVSGTALRHVLGCLLIVLHVWAAMSSYEVLGDFGWFYSDFFLLEHLPSRLAYTGIYRFLNNPERSMGGAAFLGLSLISNSKLVFSVALVSHLSHWWFLSRVEGPHMQRLYGDRLRKDGGLTKTLKNVADKTLKTKAGKHGPEIRRVVREVRGSIGKVEERVSEAVEEFLDHARPMFSEVVHDTKVLLQQSRERLIITRVATDMSAYDRSRYSITLASSSSASAVPRFVVGQPIRVSWTAPANHSRKDWIGIYRLGSSTSTQVTNISSCGKWAPIFEEEYDGEKPVKTGEGDRVNDGDAGEVVFRGNQLPWGPGKYELRYHHDGKHNVMSRVAPIEIIAHKAKDNSPTEVRKAMTEIVCLALDSDPALVPKSSRAGLRSPVHGAAALDSHAKDVPASAAMSPALSASSTSDAAAPGTVVAPDALDDDDFILMDAQQAKRIASMCEQSFGVEISPDVVLAEPNVGLLSRRVLGARSLVRSAGVEVLGGEKSAGG
ncbi:phosphatidylethanolamine N-methyltransferase [Cryptotrichosporon argae]